MYIFYFISFSSYVKNNFHKKLQFCKSGTILKMLCDCLGGMALAFYSFQSILGFGTQIVLNLEAQFVL